MAVAVRAGSAAAHEMLVVLALAVAGLLLAVLVAFLPWYPASGESRQPAVVEVHSPAEAREPVIDPVRAR